MSFPVLHDKTHTAPIKSGLLAWNPMMDLLAIITDSDEVTLNRLDGQRVWTALPGTGLASEAALISLAWRPDGRILAVGCKDGSIYYLDLHDGKTIRSLTIFTANSHHDITFMEWIEGSKGRSQNIKSGVRHDVRSHLPKLAPLPTSNTERMFINTHAIQTFIHDLEEPRDLIDLLAISTSGFAFRHLLGSLQLNLDDPTSTEVSRLRDYCASPDMKHHILALCRDGHCDMQMYALNIFNHDADTVDNIINTFNDFQGVSLYLKEAIDYITEEYNAFGEPKQHTFDELQQTCLAAGSSSSSVLFCFAMTGNPDDELRQWLDDHINDRIVKRWEKMSQSTFANITKVTNESCIQAGYRLIIMLTQLRTMSLKPHQIEQSIYPDTAQIDTAIKAIELVIAQSVELIQCLSAELELFLAFCKWFAYAIDNLNSEEEKAETIMPVPMHKVVKYLKYHVDQSSVAGFFTTSATVDVSQFIGLDTHIHTASLFPKLSGPGTPSLHQTLAVVLKAAADMFRGPVAALTDKWQLLRSRSLVVSKNTVVRSRAIRQQGHTTFYTALIEEQESGEDVLRIFRQDTNEGDTQLYSRGISLHVDEIVHAKIQDLQFIDDDELLVLVQSTKEDRSSHLVAFEYSALAYTPCEDMASQPSASTVSLCTIFPTKHRRLEPGVHPVNLSVNGRKGRRSGLYLQADRQRYTVFDLDDQDPESDSDAMEEDED